MVREVEGKSGEVKEDHASRRGGPWPGSDAAEASAEHCPLDSAPRMSSPGAVSGEPREREPLFPLRMDEPE